ncbi:MAG: alpha/beta hydrolase [Candidatus Latescibacterota bacterium]|nr:MAG: alpha/beta hydrolase [Candidatus Latescibacterota bacterium]
MSRQLQRIELPGEAGRLEALLALPPEPPRAVALLCHPHPQHGGNMHTKALYRAGQALVESGLAVLRFNFRGVGRSAGAFAAGVGELEDARSAYQWLAAHYADRPLLLGGFSFGAWVALRLAAAGGVAQALLALAPPLELYDFPPPWQGEPPLLLVAGSEDPLCPVAVLEAWGARRGAEVVVLPHTSHLLVERLNDLQNAVSRFASRLLPKAP